MVKLAKKCSVCRKVIRHQNKSGLCSYHYREKYRKSPEEIKRRKEYDKEYVKRPEVNKKIKEYQKEYYQKNKEELLKKKKIIYEKRKTKKMY